MEMNPNSITLENYGKMFEFEKFSRDIDNIDDIETLKNIC